MARDTSNLVTIPGELHSAATGNIVASTEEVFDYTTNKYQNDINQELRSIINMQIRYYICSTSGDTAAKVIDASGYTLLNDSGLFVNFTEKNTAANATLNIGQTGAKPLYYNGSRVSTDNSWYDGEIVALFYDGAAFQCNSLPDNSLIKRTSILESSVEDLSSISYKQEDGTKVVDANIINIKSENSDPYSFRVLGETDTLTYYNNVDEEGQRVVLGKEFDSAITTANQRISQLETQVAALMKLINGEGVSNISLKDRSSGEITTIKSIGQGTLQLNDSRNTYEIEGTQVLDPSLGE